MPDAAVLVAEERAVPTHKVQRGGPTVLQSTTIDLFSGAVVPRPEEEANVHHDIDEEGLGPVERIDETVLSVSVVPEGLHRRGGDEDVLDDPAFRVIRLQGLVPAAVG